MKKENARLNSKGYDYNTCPYPPLMTLRMFSKSLDLSKIPETDPNMSLFNCTLSEQKNSFMAFKVVYEWSKTKESYRFDPDVLDEFVHPIKSRESLHRYLDTNAEKLLYVEPIPLNRLPFKSFVIDFDNINYVVGQRRITELPNLADEMKVTNVFVTVNDTYFKDFYYVIVAWIDEKDGMIPSSFLIPKTEKKTVHDCAAAFYEMALNDMPKTQKYPRLIESHAEFMANYIVNSCIIHKGLIDVLSYLCAKNAEILERPIKRRPPSNKHHFAEVRTWDVALLYGFQLREYKKHTQEAKNDPSKHVGHRSPRPHMRRAHWHRYWTGKGRTELTILWIDSIAINANASGDLPVEVHDVK